jgi:hypothetical protein
MLINVKIYNVYIRKFYFVYFNTVLNSGVGVILSKMSMKILSKSSSCFFFKLLFQLLKCHKIALIGEINNVMINFN